MKGFFGIGCMGMKTSDNYGTLFRTAAIFGADFIFLIGPRFKRQSTDTCKSWRQVPLFEYADFDDFNSHRPYGCQLVGIELDSSAKPLHEFNHPKQAAYLLGAEDHGLSLQAMNACNDVVYLPGEYSLNVSVAGSIVLYDRITRI